MKFTFDGFQQKKMIELEIDIIDSAILRWFIDFKEKGKMAKHIVQGEAYYWVSYEKIVRDYPVINVTKETIGKRMRRMAKLDILKHHTVKNGGTFSCYTLGDKYNQLIRKNYNSIESEEKDNDEVIDDSLSLKEQVVAIRKSKGSSFKTTTKDYSIKNTLLLNKSKQSEADSDLDKSFLTKPSIVKDICKEYGVYPDKSFVRELSMYKIDDLCEMLKKIPKKGVKIREAYLRRILQDQPKAIAKNTERKDQTKEEFVQETLENKMTKEISIEFDNVSSLSDKEKSEIEERAYKRFLKESSGENNKIMRAIFEKSRKAFISKELHSMIEKGLIGLTTSSAGKLGA